MSSHRSLQGKVASGVFWSFFANWGQRGVALLVFVVLARLLGPHDLGVFAAVMVVLAFAQQFADQGLGEAIVQRQVITPPILNAVALINFGLALMALLAVWVAAPLIAKQMGFPEMVDVLRTVTSILLIAALTFTQQAMLRRNFNYRWLAVCTLTGTVISGALGIGFAIAGFGVWAMVVQAVSSAVLTSLIMWTRPQWPFRFEFDFRGVRPLVSYGTQRLVSHLLELLSTRYIEIIIAVTLGASALGIYAVGVRIYQNALQTVGASVLNVTLNGLARIAHDRSKLREIYCRLVGMMTGTISAGFVFAAVLAPELTVALFGEKFAESARIMQAVMLWGALQAVLWCTGIAYNAIGRPSILLGLSILRAVVILPTVWLARHQDLVTIVHCFIAAQLVVAPVNLFIARRVLGISLKRQVGVMLPFAIPLIAMGVVVTCVRQFEPVLVMPPWGRLGVLALTGGLTYALIILLTARARVRDIYLVLRRARHGA